MVSDTYDEEMPADETETAPIDTPAFVPAQEPEPAQETTAEPEPESEPSPEDGGPEFFRYEWKDGIFGFGCRYCPWDTLDIEHGGGGEAAVRQHIETHRPAYWFEQPKPLIYGPNGEPL